MEQFEVDGARLATEPPKHGLADRGFDRSRAFQNRVVEWIHEGDAPVATVRAPTGAGKTATFHELIDANQLTLLVYPTNALLRQQRERFTAAGIDATVLNGSTLEGHGHVRTENLLDFVDPYGTDHEVVLTNPDILQATVQDMYRGDHAMRFFDRFDAVVYDEFHFYGPLAASGLLLQIKIIADRHANPEVVLASATPNEDFVEFVRHQLQLDVCDIEAEYVDDGDQFRYPVEVRRHEATRLIDERESIVELLEEEFAAASDYDEPHVALVFNSAKDSNDFHDFIEEENPELFEHVEKDNGFDTDDETVDLSEEEFLVLNTTSKGEVGLDYDITTLVMENPARPSAFLQRFGRAGRESRATVHVYGLGRGPWGDDVEFPTFAQQVYDGLEDERTAQEALADLVGFRGAYGVTSRETSYGGFDPEIYADLAANVDRYGRWKHFIDDVRNELDAVGGLGGKYTERDPEAKLLEFTERCFEVFRGLRGRSLSAQIQYPRGDRVGLTTYDLTRTLRNYDIDHVTDDDVIVVEPGDEDSLSVVTARLPAYETEPTKYDEPTPEIEDTLQEKIHRRIDRVSGNDDFEVDDGTLHRFFNIVRITDAIVPERLTTTTHEIEAEDDGNGPPSIEVHRRQV